MLRANQQNLKDWIEALVERYHVSLRRYLLVLGCDEALVDDFVQESFLSVLRKPFEERSEAQTFVYLRTTARNHFFSHMRKHRRMTEIADIDIAEEYWQAICGAERENPLLEFLERCMAELPERSRLAIEMRYGRELSRPQIADKLSISSESAKKLLQRTRAALAECVERRAVS